MTYELLPFSVSWVRFQVNDQSHRIFQLTFDHPPWSFPHFFIRVTRHNKLNFAYLWLLRYTFEFVLLWGRAPHAANWFSFQQRRFINPRRSFLRYFHINALTREIREMRAGTLGRIERSFRAKTHANARNCFQMLQGVRSRRGRAVRWPVRFLRKLRRRLAMRHQKFAAQHPGGGRRSLHEWVEYWLLFSYLLTLHLSLVFCQLCFWSLGVESTQQSGRREKGKTRTMKW